MTNPQQNTVVAALYKFAPFPEFETHRQGLQSACEASGVKGTLLLAPEGINGTIAGSRQGINAVLNHIRSIPALVALEHKESLAPEMPFLRMKVRLKREIVTMGQPDVDPLETVGTYVEPEDWNALISQPDIVVVDTRNDYEVAIGTFEGARDPNIATFSEFPDWVAENLPPASGTATPKIAMFCTGGIRCEKSTAYLKSKGYRDVFHLKGGILKYLERVAPQQSLWNGECFVFDRRVSVGHGLVPGPYQLCAICRQPLLAEQGESGGYATTECETCAKIANDDRRRRAHARQRQIDLAKARGQSHLGPQQQSRNKTRA